MELKRYPIAAICILASASLLEAQISITSKDMFNAIGQYSRAHANSAQVSVAGRLGQASATMQSWDFSSGPTDQIYRFDYVDVNDGGHGADFPQASFAERFTVEGTTKVQWMFLRQTAGIGRSNYGFYSEEFHATMPSNPFSEPIIDFPDPIQYGARWQTSTSFETEVIGLPVVVDYASDAVADAFGVINQPGLGFDDCLRVNELATYTYRADVEGTGNFQTVAVYYIRTLYWLRPNRGIAVQITSPESDTPPPDNFTTAASFVRMFETNHPIGEHELEPVSDLRITLGSGPNPDRALLNWTHTSTASAYRIEITSTLAQPDSWTELGRTSGNFWIDTTIRSAPIRFYRLVSIE